MEWQYISSKSNALVVRMAKLKDKKYRRSEGLFRFDGIKLFGEAVSKSAPLLYVFLMESVSERFKDIVDKCGMDLNVFVLSDDAFYKLTDEQSPEGIITVCKQLENISYVDEYSSAVDVAKNGTIMMLESVRDAGNLGTVIRSARAFGIDALILSSDCADIYNSKTVRGAMGALFSQKIIVVDDITACIEEIRKNGSRVFAAALLNDAKKLGSFELRRGDAIVIGNEGHGLSSAVMNACDECVFIPMEQGSESLNASIAASICMWELYKIK